MFDWVEKIILILVCATNTLWQPIFMYQIWELCYLIKTIEDFDKFNTIKIDQETQPILKITKEEQIKAEDQFLERREQKLDNEVM